MATEPMVSQAPGRSGIPDLPGGAPWPSTTGASWRWLTLCLLCVDTTGLLLGFVLAYVGRFDVGLPFLEMPPHSLQVYVSLVCWAVPIWLVLLAVQHLYDRRILQSGAGQYSAIANASTAGSLVLVVISFLDRDLIISRGWLVLTWLVPMLTLGGLRFAARRVLRALHRRGVLITPTLVVGANEEGAALAEQFLSDPGAGLRPVGFVDATLPPGTPVLDGLEVLGTLELLDDLVRRTGAREIVAASTAVSRAELLELYSYGAQNRAVQIRLSSGLFDVLTTGVRVHEVSSVPLLTPDRVRITGGDALLKTLVDYVAASVALVAVAPVLVLVAVLIKLDSPGPVLYRRRVLGVSGKPFDAFKFRTMFTNADELLRADAQLRSAFERGYKLRDDPRVTRVGRLLRRTSFDELPQLINVLRGQMSLVGPRMIAPEEAVRYGKWQRSLMTVKPGITGPWQVAGRADLPYEQRVKLSIQYIRNYSLWLDIAILVRTIGVVVRGKGAY